MPLSEKAHKKAIIGIFFILILSLLSGLKVSSEGMVSFSLESLLIPYWLIPIVLLFSYLLIAFFLNWMNRNIK